MTVHRQHEKPENEVRNAVEHIAGEMQREFGFDYSWNQNRLHFQRIGVSGHIALNPGSVEVKIQKSFFIPVSDSHLKSKVEEYMDKYL